MKPRSQEVLCRPDAVNVAHVVEHCRVLGPGERFVLWVQGCPLHCSGCHNPGFMPFVDATWMRVRNLAAHVLAVTGIEGVTFVGGEPFAQAKALGALARRVRRVGLTVMAYSGYTLEELTSGEVPFAKDLLRSSDLLMDGRFRCDLPTQKPWRGSDNQRLVALSDFYASQVEAWNKPTGQDFELRVRGDGTLEVLGIPPKELALLSRQADGDTVGNECERK